MAARESRSFRGGPRNVGISLEQETLRILDNETLTWVKEKTLCCCLKKVYIVYNVYIYTVVV